MNAAKARELQQKAKEAHEKQAQEEAEAIFPVMMNKINEFIEKTAKGGWSEDVFRLEKSDEIPNPRTYVLLQPMLMAELESKGFRVTEIPSNCVDELGIAFWISWREE